MRSGKRPADYPLTRSAHYLRRSESVGWPQCSVALVVHTERDGPCALQRELQVRLLGWQAVAWQEQQTISPYHALGAGDDACSLWSYLLNLQVKCSSVWVWQLGAAHGLTVLGFWKLLERGEWTIPGLVPMGGSAHGEGQRHSSSGVCVLSDPPTIIIAKRSHVPGVVRWLDVRNLGIDSAADLDCVPLSAQGLARWLIDWYACVRDLKLGGLRSTAAAQAWHGWRRSYLTEPLLVHNNERAIRIERDSVHSGRCEAGQIGRIKGPVYHLDCSANYPGCASGNLLPVRHVRTGTCTMHQLTSLVRDGFLSISRVSVDTRTACAPAREGGLTIFPIGQFTTTLCWPEIELLRENGAVVEIGDTALYEPGRPFSHFFASLWKARVTSTLRNAGGRSSCIKRLMNALIGRTASWDWRWLAAPGVEPMAPWETWEGLLPDTDHGELLRIARIADRAERAAALADHCCRYRSVGWHVQYEKCAGEGEDSMPALYSWVCSLARVKLWRYLMKAGREHVYYYDTDSLWTDQAGRDSLERARALQPDTMGGLRQVRVYDWIDVRGFKYYATPNGVYCAGVGEDYTISSDGSYVFYSPERLADSLRRSDSPAQVELRYKVPVKRPYRHGIVGNDGRVHPIVLPR